MFGLFKKKKDKSLRKDIAHLEHQNNFYEHNEDDDLSDDEIDDEEYNRRITQELARRKDIANGRGKSLSNSPALQPDSTSKPSTPKSPTPAVYVKSVVSPVPTSKSSPVSATNPKASRPFSATSAPIALDTSNKNAPSPMLVSQTHTPRNVTTNTPTNKDSSRPYSATYVPNIVIPAETTTGTVFNLSLTPTGIPPSAQADRPYSAISISSDSIKNTLSDLPTSSSLKEFEPNATSLRQLVSMGFPLNTSKMALKMKNNHAGQAAELLLEHTNEEIEEMFHTSEMLHGCNVVRTKSFYF